MCLCLCACVCCTHLFIFQTRVRTERAVHAEARDLGSDRVCRQRANQKTHLRNEQVRQNIFFIFYYSGLHSDSYLYSHPGPYSFLFLFSVLTVL